MEEKNWNEINIIAENTPQEMIPDSDFEFISEHYFGYTKNAEKTYEYEVKHPKWRNFKIISSEIKVDFKENYGEDFEFLNYQNPISIMLAEGSEIEVYTKKKSGLFL